MCFCERRGAPLKANTGLYVEMAETWFLNGTYGARYDIWKTNATVQLKPNPIFQSLQAGNPTYIAKYTFVDIRLNSDAKRAAFRVLDDEDERNNWFFNDPLPRWTRVNYDWLLQLTKSIKAAKQLKLEKLADETKNTPAIYRLTEDYSNILFSLPKGSVIISSHSQYDAVRPAYVITNEVPSGKEAERIFIRAYKSAKGL